MKILILIILISKMKIIIIKHSGIKNNVYENPLTQKINCKN